MFGRSRFIYQSYGSVGFTSVSIRKYIRRGTFTNVVCYEFGYRGV